MIFVKGGIGAKLVLLVLGLGIGVGGVAAGASYHAARHPTTANQRLFVGHISALDGDVVTVRTIHGATLAVHIIPRTVIRHAGRPIALATLHVGDLVLIRINRHAGTNVAVSIGQLKRVPTTTGP